MHSDQLQKMHKGCHFELSAAALRLLLDGKATLCSLSGHAVRVTCLKNPARNPLQDAQQPCTVSSRQHFTGVQQHPIGKQGSMSWSSLSCCRATLQFEGDSNR